MQPPCTCSAHHQKCVDARSQVLVFLSLSAVHGDPVIFFNLLQATTHGQVYGQVYKDSTALFHRVNV